jgi:hypothetical protein
MDDDLDEKDDSKEELIGFGEAKLDNELDDESDDLGDPDEFGVDEGEEF